MRQWWERRSLRLRLTLWYAVTSTIILLALGGMLLFVVHERLVSQMDRQLRGDFEMVESRVARDSAGNLRWLGYGHDKDEVQWKNKRVRGSKSCLRPVQYCCVKGHQVTGKPFPR